MSINRTEIASPKKYDEYFTKNKKAILEDYFSFLKFPSISADPAHKKDVEQCGDWVACFLKKSGFHVDTWKTPANPVIFAEHKAKNPHRPTILIYYHYDVQPVDPLELWNTPPFEPTLVGEEVYARGACDDKGQSLYTLHALQAFLALGNQENLNIKVIVDGDEEVGSEGLFYALDKYSERLQADHTLIVDAGIPSLQQPAVTLGCRGIITLNVECTGSNIDLHSGCLGGIAYNPLRALVEVLAKVWDKEGKICIEGFYEGVEVLDKKDLLDVDLKEMLDKFAIKGCHHEKGFTSLESNWTRPTFEINGMSGGYAGPGFKTVIPSKASCKISCRLVPGQDPQKIGEAVEQFFKKHIAKGLDLKIELGHGGKAYVASAQSPFAHTIKEAYEKVMKLDTGFILTGGTLPICTKLAEVSGGDTICMGYGLDDDCIHAPNEHFGVDRLKYGLMTVGTLLELLAGKT